MKAGWPTGGGAEEKGGWVGGKDCCGWDTGGAGAWLGGGAGPE